MFKKAISPQYELTLQKIRQENDDQALKVGA
jgi:hypothetical protein